MTAYTDNHYVPQWYQRRFLPRSGEAKLHYLDLVPKTFKNNKTGAIIRRDPKPERWGTGTCFQEPHLYTTKWGNWQSTEIEEMFFGHIDNVGARAVEWWSRFKHGTHSVNPDAFRNLLQYMSVQKLRTPKGLSCLSTNIARASDRNSVLLAMQRFQNYHCAIWGEAVWSLVDANKTPTGFIISDHPVTVYNRDCFPGSEQWGGDNDPDIWLHGTHTLFPLSPRRMLVLTNLSWVRNPYQSARASRPNPQPLRQGGMFSFLKVQTGRELSEVEVNQVNLIIKKRARRFIGSPIEAWLYPEKNVPTDHWRKLDDRYLLMPDPRSVSFTSSFFFGNSERGTAGGFDAYGHPPGHPEFDDRARHDREWKTSLAFQGEYARLFGPWRRGRIIMGVDLVPEEDDPEFHKGNLEQEPHMPRNFKRRRDQRAVES